MQNTIIDSGQVNNFEKNQCFSPLQKFVTMQRIQLVRLQALRLFKQKIEK